MQREREAFRLFLSMHAHKARPTEEPSAHLQFCARYVDGEAPTLPSQDCPLIAFTRDEIVKEFDKDAELVRYLLHQMSTYECTTQRVVGLVFDRSTILSDVLYMP